MTGIFQPHSAIRRVLGEPQMGFYGLRALLLQALHPLAYHGLIAHSASAENPYPRLARTAAAVDLVVWGPRESAEAVCAHARAAHHRVRGALGQPAGPFAAGTRYRGDDPELLRWVLASLFDSARVTYSLLVAPLSADEQEQLWQDFRRFGIMFGLPPQQMPADLAGFDRYWQACLDEDWLGLEADQRAWVQQVVFGVPLPLALRGLRPLLRLQVTGSLPEQAREALELPWDPAAAAAFQAYCLSSRLQARLLPQGIRLRGARLLLARATGPDYQQAQQQWTAG